MGDENIYSQRNAPEESNQEVPGQTPSEAPLPELSPEQMKAVEETKAMVQQYAPEIIPFIRVMYREGMINGWRSVRITTKK